MTNAQKDCGESTPHDTHIWTEHIQEEGQPPRDFNWICVSETEVQK